MIENHSTSPYTGCDFIPEVFEVYRKEFAGLSLESFLQAAGRVVVKNDPKLIKVFGQDVVDRYEAMLRDAEY